jgi:hypothetical protein
MGVSRTILWSIQMLWEADVVFLCAGDGDTSHLDESVPIPGSFELVSVSSGTLLCGTLRNFEFRNSFYFLLIMSGVGGLSYDTRRKCLVINLSAGRALLRAYGPVTHSQYGVFNFTNQLEYGDC